MLFSKKNILLLIGPVLFLTLAYGNLLPFNHEVSKVIGVTTWMLIWWISEIVDLPVTALLPIVIFPSFGILDLATTASNYSNATILLFLSGFVFALAIEKHKLHERIALHIIRWIGTSSNRVVLGFMVATAFISMWVNNTAAALLMFPIATSVLSILQQSITNESSQKEFVLMSKALLLGLAYSASIGGTATPIGTPTNAVLTGYFNEKLHTSLAFGNWLLIGLPLASIMTFMAYFILTRLVFKSRVAQLPELTQIINHKITELGKITFPEIVVITVFLLTTAAWILRVVLIKLPALAFLNDTIIGVSGAIILFIVPHPASKDQYIFVWKDMQKLPWGILFMIGGGLALAKTLESSGIVQLIANSVKNSGINNGLIVLILIVGITLLLKTVIANTALATILIPMVIGIANASGIDPIMLGAPTTFAASFAFILPMSTPPNAIVLTLGHIHVKDMMKAGIAISLIGYLLLISLNGFYRVML